MKKITRRWHYLLRKNSCAAKPVVIFHQGLRKQNLLGASVPSIYASVLFPMDSTGYTL
jgi:hypothetical protein